jgi:glycosyltransferase involved in cell wall biosynthesis
VRVVLVDPAGYTAPYDHSLAAALAARGHEVDLLTSPAVFGEAPLPDGYRRHELFLPLSTRLVRRAPRSRVRVPLKGLEYVPSSVRLVRRTRALRPAVVHVQWLPLPRYDVRWLRLLARDHATVLTAHDVVPRRRGQADAWREVLATVDRVVVHSRRAVDQLAGLGVERNRIEQIPHAIFSAPPGLDLTPPRGHRLLFFGLLREYKGLDVLVRALPTIFEDVPDARLVVAGDPLDPVEPLQALAGTLGVEERIEWRLHYVGEGELVELMDAATVVVLPYRRLDSSGVLAAALGHARPVVASDVGSLGDIVREFGAGVVVPPGDEAALAEACVRLLTDGDALEQAFRGTGAAREGLSWGLAAEAHERLYETLLAS